MEQGDRDYHEVLTREIEQNDGPVRRELPQPAGISTREVGQRAGTLAPGVARQRKSVDIALVCHEANRAYCISLGDHSQERWSTAPTWQQESAINGVQMHMGNIEKGVETTPRESHESWLAEKLANGWTHGPVKDATLKTHPSCVPYDDLSDAERRKDVLFGAIVKALYGPLP